MTSKTKVVIFILNYNSSDFKSIVYKSIESALGINYPLLDVVVIDNASSDGSFETIEDRFGKDIILIRLDRNYGYSGGNELGLKRYKAERGFPEYAVFMNNDFIVTNGDFIRDLIEFLENKEDVVLAQGFNLVEDGKHIDNAGYFIDAPMNIISRYNGLKPSDCSDKCSYVSSVNGACFISKVKAIMKVRDYIFERRIFAYGDEPELAWNLWSYGLKSMFVSTTVGIHQFSKSFKKFPVLATYLVARNRYALRRYYFRNRLRVLSMPTVLYFLLTFPFRPFQGLKGRIITKAFMDAYLENIFSDSAIGPFHPLIMIPQKFDYMVRSSIMPRKLRKKIFDKMSVMSVNDNDIKMSSKPFLISVDVKL